MNAPRDHYWFPARRFGLGWGFPTRWQGWLAFATYIGAFVLGIALLHGRATPAAFIAFASVTTLAILVVCWMKGEPLRWRWGGK